MAVATRISEKSVSQRPTLRAALVFVRSRSAGRARLVDAADVEAIPWARQEPIRLVGVRKIMLNA